MFTGIIESQGTIRSIEPRGSGITFWISSTLTPELKIDQSLSHDGVCLTIEELQDDRYRVTAIQETLEKTNLGDRKPGDSFNLERSLLMNSRLDGHIVQGHADSTAACIRKKDSDGSWLYEFKFPEKFSSLIIEKGSVCINGISLTVFNVKKKSFQVAVIPYTYEHTNIQSVMEGSKVNIEFDVIGKYIQRISSLKK
jgi:riboflavin synthase